MSWLEIVVLAVIQGLTEFLPISSSAHLILPSQVLGWQDQGLAFDVAVHVGTLLAVVLYFRQDIKELAVGWFRQISGYGSSPESRLAWFVLIATLPAGITGLTASTQIEVHLRSALVIALATIGFGLLLAIADRTSGQRSITELTLRDVLLIGCAQALALIPGTSRSGITMTAGLMLGLTRKAAARFSFLLSIPLILAAGLLKGMEMSQTGSEEQWLVLLSGTLISGISAYICIHLFLTFLEKIGFMPFVIYRIVLGTVLLIWFV